MTNFDYFIIILFAVSFLVGYRRGLLRQLGTFCGFFCAVAVTRALSGTVTKWLGEKGYFENIVQEESLLYHDYVKEIIVSVIIFTFVFFLTKLLVRYVQLVVETLKLGWLNRLGGIVFTVLMSFLVLSAVLNVLQLFKHDGPIVPRSGLYEGKMAEAVMELAPLTFGLTASWWNNFGDTKVNLTENNAITHNE